MKTMRIAIFRLASGVDHIGTETTEKWSTDTVRVSEYVDVEFPPVDESVAARAIELQRKATIEYHRRELAKLVGPVEVAQLAKRQAE
jgi:hypothetical protein